MAYGHLFSNFHAIPVGDGISEVVSVLFGSEAARDTWESIPGVQIVGSELDRATVTEDAAAILAGLGVTTTMTAKDVRKHVRTTIPHPLF
jgi:hypothetical protein